MHILFEGVLAKEIQLLLKYCCEKKFFTPNQLNKYISTFDYGPQDNTNMPSSFDSIDHINQRASQWWCLGRYLPLIISQYVPDGDKNWACFLMLLSIMSILTSFFISPEDCALLAVLH